MGHPKAFLIDGTAFCYRAFYAIRDLSTADGRPTNAVYGFAAMLQALRNKARPDYLAVAFDVGKPTFRHKKFDEYKIQRKPMPDALIGQIPVVKTLLAAYRIPVYEREGFEAEDVLATIARRIVPEGAEVFLVTGDKDALQLVNSHVKVYNPHHNGAVLDADAVKARYGVGPERMVDLMALMGDEIDNIPGVPGIGEKTATQLLQRYGSLEELYRHLDEMDSPQRRKKLEAAREQVALARELATIETDVPLEVTLKDLAIQAPDWRGLSALFRELDFKRLLREIEDRVPVTPQPGLATRTLESAKEIAALAARLKTTPCAIACWPVGDPAQSLVLALTEDAAGAWVMPLEPSGALGAWLEDAAAQKIAHDAKGAMRACWRMGMAVRGLSGDTMIAAHLLNPARTSQTLQDLADEYLEERLGPSPALDGALALTPLETIEQCGRAAAAVMRLHGLLMPRLDEHGLGALYRDLELPLVSVLAEMERTGIAVDVAYLAGLKASMDAKLLQLTDTIYAMAGTSFNLNSPKQLAQVLFERLKLPVVKRTKTGPSTDSGVLQQLSEQHPLPKHLIEYRELAKLVSTYVDALPKLAGADGRIHTSFNQTATATGRLSSSEPNLQNIPSKTELGRSIRKAFIPGIPSGVLVAADYSQIELRILAHLSGDERLREAFLQGRDIHRFTASLIYGLPESEIGPEQRSAMKAVNFGIIYGMTSHGLSKELGVPFDAAQAFIDAYFERYPKVRAYLDGQIERARRDGYVQTMLGRRRYIPEVRSSDMMLRQFGERMAVNAPIQGTAADLIKRAMVQLARMLPAEGLAARMVLQVHDELVFEAPERELARLVPLVRRVMEGAIALDVPLTVTVKAGPSWLDLQLIEP